MSYVESHAQHFGGRILVSGQRSKALQGSSHETNRNSRKGRPKFELSLREIWSLWSAGFKWSQIPQFLLISECTLRWPRQEVEWRIGNEEFSKITDDKLDVVVREILCLSPNSEERMILGALRGKHILIQRNPLRDSIHRVDPISSWIIMLKLNGHVQVKVTIGSDGWKGLKKKTYRTVKCFIAIFMKLATNCKSKFVLIIPIFFSSLACCPCEIGFNVVMLFSRLLNNLMPPDLSM